MQLPNRVTIELTNRCNRACKGCPRIKMTYPLGDMSQELFNTIIEQLPHNTVIVPFFRGESLLHPLFIEFMDRLRGFNVVQLATNGDLLTAENLKCIYEACSFISLSLHRFRLPNSQDLICRGNGINTQVSILETLIPPNEKSLFVKSWLKQVDRVRIYVEHSHVGYGDILNPPRWSMNNGDLPCHKPFQELAVYWDGKVALCNHDWDNQTDFLGDLTKQTIEQVWNSEKYETIREWNLQGKRHNIPSCKVCDYWMVSYLPNKMFGELYEVT